MIALLSDSKTFMRVFVDEDTNSNTVVRFFMEEDGDPQMCTLIEISPEDWAKMIQFINSELSERNS